MPSLFSIMKNENVRCALFHAVRRKRGGKRFDGSQCSASAFLRSAEIAPSCGRKLRAAAFRAVQQARSDAGEVRAAPSVWRQRGALVADRLHSLSFTGAGESKAYHATTGVRAVILLFLHAFMAVCAQIRESR